MIVFDALGILLDVISFPALSWTAAYDFVQYSTFLNSGSQPSLNGSPQNFHTSLMWVEP